MRARRSASVTMPALGLGAITLLIFENAGDIVQRAGRLALALFGPLRENLDRALDGEAFARGAFALVALDEIGEIVQRLRRLALALRKAAFDDRRGVVDNGPRIECRLGGGAILFLRLHVAVLATTARRTLIHLARFVPPTAMLSRGAMRFAGAGKPARRGIEPILGLEGVVIFVVITRIVANRIVQPVAETFARTARRGAIRHHACHSPWSCGKAPCS